MAGGTGVHACEGGTMKYGSQSLGKRYRVCLSVTVHPVHAATATGRRAQDVGGVRGHLLRHQTSGSLRWISSILHHREEGLVWQRVPLIMEIMCNLSFYHPFTFVDVFFFVSLEVGVVLCCERAISISLPDFSLK